MIEILSTEKKVKGVLTSRDMEILKALAKYRYLTTQDIRRLLFKENKNTLRTQVRLKFLNSLGLVDRLMQFNRDGSRKAFAYLLSQDGADYLIENNEDVPLSFGKYSHKVKYLQLQHCVDISSFWVTLTLAVEKAVQSVEELAKLQLALFIPDWQIREKALEGNSLRNKELWQEISVPNAKEKFVIYPDALFLLSANDEQNKTQSKLCALEVDRGTEGLEILRKKVLAYGFAHKQGKFKKYPGNEDLTILIQCSSEKRAANIRQALIGTQGEELTWITSVVDVSDDTLLLKDIWIDSRGKRRAILA
jgi:Replication-relaxation